MLSLLNEVQHQYRSSLLYYQPLRYLRARLTLLLDLLRFILCCLASYALLLGLLCFTFSSQSLASFEQHLQEFVELRESKLHARSVRLPPAAVQLQA